MDSTVTCASPGTHPTFPDRWVKAANMLLEQTVQVHSHPRCEKARSLRPPHALKHRRIDVPKLHQRCLGICCFHLPCWNRSWRMVVYYTPPKVTPLDVQI
jgi:hypothetical protein